MSCEKNGNRAGAVAASNGVSGTASKFGNVLGAASSRIINQIDGRKKTSGNKVAEFVGDVAIDVGKYAAGAGLLSIPVAGVPLTAVYVVSHINACKLSADRSKGPVSQVKLARRAGLLRKPVKVLVFPHKAKKNTTVFSCRRFNWENQAEGEGHHQYSRLVRKGLPRDFHYFKGKLSDEDAVRIAEGELDPKDHPGYSGTVSRFDSLTPTAALAKHAMIKAALDYKSSVPAPVSTNTRAFPNGSKG